MKSLTYSAVPRRWCAILLLALLAGCAAPPPAADAEKIDHLLQLIQQRLGYMDDVARNKWNSGAAIEDLPREREIIDGLGRQAADYGLDAATARDFFRAQIEASKVIQRTRFSEWQAARQLKFAGVRDPRQAEGTRRGTACTQDAGRCAASRGPRQGPRQSNSRRHSRARYGGSTA